MFQIDFSGKTVLISGANAGLGLGIARQMAKAGANISGCARGGEDAVFKKEMMQYGARVLYTKCDVTCQTDLENFVARTVERFGGVDVLISNAGANVFTGADKSTDDDWQNNMELNLASHWRLAKLCKPYLEKNNGVIIIMSSNHAYYTIPGCFPYNISKTALTALVQSLSIEWSPFIRTVGIAPGFIDTPGNQKWFDSFSDPEAERQKTIDLHPVKRIGTVDEIGGWCVFLASEYASFSSGTTYLIDGGRSALMQQK